MKKNFLQYCQASLKNFIEATINIFIFLPYFFSVLTLLKTLFYPWKNLVSQKTKRGFYFNDWLERLSFDFISRLIGFFMRLSVISFYFLIQIVYVIIIPIIFILYCLSIPFSYLRYLFEKTDLEKENLLKNKFINEHLLKLENYEKVNQWFHHYYADLHFGSKWWRLTNLLTFPPLARDWAIGFTPLLDQYVDDLTSPTYQNKIKSAYDREKEIDQIERILSKSEEANVVIVGEEGVGKHTIVDSLAKRIYEGKVNNILAYKRVLKLNLEKILNQTTDHKQRENFLEKLLAEATQAKSVVLLIENFDKYIASGADRIDLTIPIEKYAKTNKLQIIAISQPFFYQKFIFSNSKINRLFEKVDVYEIKKDEAEKLLLDKALGFEKRYKLLIPYETIKNTIDKSDYFITYIPFPEKAIVLLDSACVFLSQGRASVVEERSGKTAEVKKVMPEVIDKVLSEATHIPTSLTDQMKVKLVNLENLLSFKVIQQVEAVTKLASALRRSFLLMGKRKKPLASFLFLGPTGVGKTETAKAISQIFFGSEKYLIRFDMSSYQSKLDINNLIGSIENGNPGLLTSAIRQNPYGVLLLDEFEKADKDLINIFLTVLDEGYFTDGAGKRVDCKNLVIIATSNAKDENVFSPELLNRFDGVIVYQTLNQQSIIQIAKKYLASIAEDIDKLYRVKVAVSDRLLTEIVQKGYDPKFGARNLERVIREQVEDKIAKLILEEKVKEGETISL